MQLHHVFSELGQGLRRNVSMHVAVVLTLFVSLTLVGMGVLLNQQADKTAQRWGSLLQITVWLCLDETDNTCTGAVTDAQKNRIEAVVEDNPEVATYRLRTKREALEQVKEILGPERFEGPYPAATVEDMPESYRITLKDPEEYEGITSAVVGLDGVSYIQDEREALKPIYGSISALRWASLGTAVFLGVAALLLVANTIRLAAFARRREIGIMRLVGASTLYITLPFLLEALVTAAIGVALAAGALGAFLKFGIMDTAATGLAFIPWVGVPEYLVSLAWIGVVGPVLTIVPTLLLTRKYLKV